MMQLDTRPSLPIRPGILAAPATTRYGLGLTLHPSLVLSAERHREFAGAPIGRGICKRSHLLPDTEQHEQDFQPLSQLMQHRQLLPS